MAPERRKYVLFSVIVLVELALDQVTKVWARGAVGPEGSGKVIQVIDGTLFFRYAENPGVAFSMFRDLSGGRWILTLVALAAFGLVIHYLRKTEPTQTRLQAALGLVGGGAVGNLVDRILFGRVSDFIVADLGFWPANPWPAFNVADAGLVVGVGLMAIDMWKPQRSEGAEGAGAPAAGTKSK